MSIKLSDFTKKVLGNIAEFNGGVIINQSQNGKTIINTMSQPAGDLMLTVEIPEQFNYDFVVSDLSRFLNIQSTLDSPELELHKQYMIIKSDSSGAKIKYSYADARAVIVPPGTPEIGDEIVTVDIPKEKMDKIRKQANILHLPHIQFSVDDGKIVCTAKDCNNPSSNTISHDLGDANGMTIDEDVIVASESLKIVPDDYQLSVCENAIKLNPLNNKTMTYIIARIMDV